MLWKRYYITYTLRYKIDVQYNFITNKDSTINIYKLNRYRYCHTI